MVGRIYALRVWKLEWLECLIEFVVAFAICVSYERIKIWIFGALSLASIGVEEPLLKLGTSFESLGKVWSQN